MSLLVVFLAGAALAALAVYVAARRRQRAECILKDLYSVDAAAGLELVKRHPKLLHRGQIYHDLHRLEDDGLIESREHPEGKRWNDLPARRIYFLTRAGERVARLLVNANQ